MTKYKNLRNLPTHTVNNLLQRLSNVKSIQYFVVKQILTIIHIMCEVSLITLSIIQNTAYLIRKGQNRKSQKLEFRLKNEFQ